ncbi:hypothetical protein [Actinomadura sp. DC4]|uniref:hypothetical protein n=1 Tax=Actinomadura sp. DC4 TaxID=3055069 RepID=UPI0025AF8D90|nr:hypothetical protein [Actinomadura sp. DC4]MDN3358830.1 hypothetical protein [Actinomadura sp. DC4]
MKCGSQIAVAVVGGYVLGRSRKTRMAILLALMAAGGGKLPIGPEDLLRKTPLGGPLDKLTSDLRGQLVDAGMNVAKKAASSRIDSLSDRLQERAETLRGTGGKAAEDTDEDEREERSRPRRDREAPPRRRREEPPRRVREPEYDEDEYDEDEYDEDEGEGEDDDYERDDDDRDDYDEPEPEPEPEPGPERRRRPPARSTRPESRRRTRDDDRPRGRSAR